MSRITISTLIAALVVASAILAPAAGAQSVDPPAAINVALANHVRPQAAATLDDHSAASGTRAASSGFVTPHSAAAAALENQSAPSGTSAALSGFNWGDAVIGAVAGFGLTMIGLGSVLVLSNRRHRAEQPAPTA